MTSTPEMAQVKVNDTDYGATPLTLNSLAAGVYAIEVTKDGFEPWRGEVEVRANQGVSAILKKKEEVRPAARVERVERIERVVKEVPATKVTVVTEPASADVAIDGKAIARGTTGEPPSLLLPNKPTTVEIRVSKKGYRTWTRRVALQVEKDNRVHVRLDGLTAWHRYLTDGEVLREAIDEAVMKAATAPPLRPEVKIGILSLAGDRGPDNPLDDTIQDAFVEALARAGFSPLERDDDLLAQIALTNSEMASAWGIPYALTGDTIRLQGHIPAADQLLAYRVLECGISKTPVEEGEVRPEPALSRRAMVRIHARIIDAKRGAVLWAGDLTSDRADEIPERVSAELENPPTRFSPERMPSGRATVGAGR